MSGNALHDRLQINQQASLKAQFDHTAKGRLENRLENLMS
jgi:hypothetical protein